MSTRNDRFNEAMTPLDDLLEGIDPSKALFLSDRGEGVRCVETALDGDAEDERDALGQRNASAVGAVLRLVWDGKPTLAATLALLIENGRNRHETLATLSRRTYYDHIGKLLRIFAVDANCTTNAKNTTEAETIEPLK